MRSRKRATEQGFTLLELLVTTGILGILWGTSLTAMNEYREAAYHSIVRQTVSEARTSFEAGKTEQDKLGGWYYFDVKTPGRITQAGANQIIPGLINKDNMWLIIQAQPGCEGNRSIAWCLVEYVRAQHCKDNFVRVYYRYGDGTEYDFTYDTGLTC
jgi:prepilin-type N-terminal cleavage/methylation domain-containing protein